MTPEQNKKRLEGIAKAKMAGKYKGRKKGTKKVTLEQYRECRRLFLDGDHYRHRTDAEIAKMLGVTVRTISRLKTL